MAHSEAGSGLLWQILLPAGTKSRGGERRAFPRWARSFPVLHEVGDIWVVGAALDISEDGLRFVSTRPYAVDDEITFLLQLTSQPSGWIKVKGAVRRSEGQEIAVQFLNLSCSDRLKLLDFYVREPQTPA